MVPCPISTVSEDKDSFDVDLAIVPQPRAFHFVHVQLSERGGSVVIFDNVTRGDDIFEAISLRNKSAFFTFSADDLDCVIFLSQLSHRRVATNKLARRDFHLQLVRQVETSFFFCFPTTIGDEYIWTFAKS